jgi:beta-1,2-mannobiose phosphorylase / 1,2-beta-oligomannan phosphorylase
MNKRIIKKSLSASTRSKRAKITKRKKRAGTRKRRQITAFTRAKENPIITPKQENGWEAWQTFNPAVILLENPEKLRNKTGRIHFLYRAIGEDGISRLGYAASSDGFVINERLSEPVYEHKVGQHPSFNIFSYFSGGSFGGAEDARIVQIDKEGTLYMTYTACDNGLRVALTSIKVDDFLNKKWKWKPPQLISPPGEIHKNWVIFPEKIGGKYAILLSIVPEIEIAYCDSLDFNGTHFIHSSRGFGPIKNPSRGCWDKWVRGVGAVPLRTPYGWLILYHAIDDNWSQYKVGAMLLDLNDPTKILFRSPEPILEPTEVYENKGFKAGVVYASGAVIKDGKLLIYYGAADSCVGVAYADLEKFLETLRKGSKPQLERKTLSKKSA